MKIAEVTSDARKVIRRLQNLYLTYQLNANTYNELMNFILEISNTGDADVLKEIAIIKAKLYNELIVILRK